MAKRKDDIDRYAEDFHKMEVTAKANKLSAAVSLPRLVAEYSSEKGIHGNNELIGNICMRIYPETRKPAKDGRDRDANLRQRKRLALWYKLGKKGFAECLKVAPNLKGDDSERLASKLERVASYYVETGKLPDKKWFDAKNADKPATEHDKKWFTKTADRFIKTIRDAGTLPEKYIVELEAQLASAATRVKVK